MTEITKPVIYFRKNRRETAVIYVRGENEAAQELKCRAYAERMKYDVAYVTRHIEDVNLCDVLLVANFSRISRKRMEFVKNYKFFKARGIRIESATGKNNIDHMFSARDIYKSLEPFFEKEFNKYEELKHHDKR